MIIINHKLFAAVTPLTACIGAQAQAPKDVVLTEERLCHKEAAEPIGVWTGAAEDGSRKTVELETADGVTLRGWVIESADAKAAYVLTFCGNNETIADAGSQARDTFFSSRLNLNVMTFDYRGTGFSEGSISLKDALADSLEIYDDVVKRAARVWMSCRQPVLARCCE